MLVTIFAIIFIGVSVHALWNADGARKVLLSQLHPHLPPTLVAIAFGSFIERMLTAATTNIIAVVALVWYFTDDDMPFVMLLAAAIALFSTWSHMRLLAVVRTLAHQHGYVPRG